MKPICGQRGQAMVEYVVVVSALLVALLAAPDVISGLQQTMTARQQGYNYAMSLSQLPYPLATTQQIYQAEGMDPGLIAQLTNTQQAVDQFNTLLEQPFLLPPITPFNPKQAFQNELSKYGKFP